MKPEVRHDDAVGDEIGPWPIFALTDREIVAGRNNKHLDFRVSVLRPGRGNDASVTVSTICTVHNLAGGVYLFFIVPFHRFGVKSLMSRAVAANTFERSTGPALSADPYRYKKHGDGRAQGCV